MASTLSGSGIQVMQQQQPQPLQKPQLQQITEAKRIPVSPSTLSPPPSTSSFSSSPRQYSNDIPESILEEGGESGSESAIEPVTPVSGRQSQDFTLHNQQDFAEICTVQSYQTTNNSAVSATPAKLAPLTVPTGASAKRRPSDAQTVTNESVTSSAIASSYAPAADQDIPGTPLSRRQTRGSTSSFKRTMSNLFRRTGSQVGKDSAFDSSIYAPSQASEPPRTSGRRMSGNPSSSTTRSNSPPDSPLEMAQNHKDRQINGTAPETIEKISENKKKNRASTGLTLRGRAVNFVGARVGRAGRPHAARRASSFDGSRPSTPAPAPQNENDHTYPPMRFPWPMPPDAGTGVKARRMSLSLPDDFTVDVAELQTEFEYQSKLLGRHGKHLGKGAASKVTLMSRKGYPTELYAVKEFRGKSHRESQSDYEKKIKSEFSIAKSLHHPNIVETIRLCTDHSRWNHVMEYCSEGDLFSLVKSGFLKGDDRKKDRLCLFKQMVQGIAYLHANGIAHRDIKLENLLITKDSKLKITDFGVSEVFSGTHPGVRESGGVCGKNMGDEIRLCSPGICGSEPYIAPEVLAKEAAYDPRALDVWGAAIVMIYMTFGGAIWNRAEAGEPQYEKLVSGWEKWEAKHPENAPITDSDYPKCYALDVFVNPPALRRLIIQMLHPDPQKRITMEAVNNNRWMKNVECCQLESYDDPTALIDATKKDAVKNGSKKIFCHTHLPPKGSGGHSLGKMPGQAGY